MAGIIRPQAARDSTRAERKVMINRQILASLAAIGIAGATLFAGCKTEAPKPTTTQATSVAVAVPSQPGAVQGKTENSDQFIWELLTQFAAPASPASLKPAVFETWASDGDTFNVNPHWPSGPEPLKFHPSVLQLIRQGKPLLTSLHPAQSSLHAAAIDVPCGGTPPAPPPGAATGGFPATGTPTPCIAEQVSRNRANYDYIVSNKLNTQAGLAAAYKSGLNVDFPADAIALKGDWVPVQVLLQWIPQLQNLDNLHQHYYTTISGGAEYGLVAIHVTSRQNPNWVWGTFENEMTPGRCDYIGCYDTFGTLAPAVPANKSAWNSQYGTCAKSPQLEGLMAKANLAPQWRHYCLKNTEVDFTASDGTPYALGNSVIEGITGNGTVAASSCITCHSYASFGPQGTPALAATNILSFNPTGQPIPGILNGSKTFSFNWGVLLAPK